MMTGNSYFDHYIEVPRSFTEAHPTILRNSIQLLERYRPKTFLEAGCGQGELLFELEKITSVQLSGFDLSMKAIEIAKSRLNPKTQLFIHQALEPLNQSYDLIVDGHLYHCLVFPEERKTYLKNVYQSLPAHGIFYVEMMAFPEQIGEDFLFNETGALFKKVIQPITSTFLHHNSYFLPFRSTFSSNEEHWFQQVGFTIEELKFTKDTFVFEGVTSKLVSILLVKK